MAKRPNYKNLIIILTIALAVVISVNFYTIYTIQQLLAKQVPVKDLAKEIVLDAMLIGNSQCNDCFDANLILEELEARDDIKFKTKTLEFNSPDAKEAVTKYGLTKFPSIVLTGDLSSIKSKLLDYGAVEKEGALLFAEPLPPYTDINGKILGRVSVTVIKDTSCKECIDMNLLVNQLKLLGVAVIKESTFTSESKEGKDAISRYKIKRVPTIVFSSEFGAYEQLAGVWKMYGDIASDGSYVMTEINPPYKDLATGTIKGLVTLTYITDTSCKECYNVSVHKDILANFGIYIADEKQYDYASLEGKALVKKYNITALPTVFLSQSAKDYKSLVTVWERVGTIESDGSFVFRKIDVMAGSTYKDLVSNKIVQVQEPAISDGLQ